MFLLSRCKSRERYPADVLAFIAILTGRRAINHGGRIQPPLLAIDRPSAERQVESLLVQLRFWKSTLFKVMKLHARGDVILRYYVTPRITAKQLTSEK